MSGAHVFARRSITRDVKTSIAFTVTDTRNGASAIVLVSKRDYKRSHTTRPFAEWARSEAIERARAAWTEATS